MNSRLAAAVLFAFSSSVFLACSSDTPGAVKSCAVDSDCGAGSRCQDGLCVVADAPPDAGLEPDAGLPPGDSTPPSLKVHKPAKDEVHGMELVVEAEVDDTGSGVAKVEAAVGDGSWAELTFTDGVGWRHKFPLAAKDYVKETVKFRATDKAGNVASAEVAFFNDGVAPKLTLQSPAVTVANASKIGSELEFKGTASDGSGKVDETEYSFDGQNWELVTNPADFTVRYGVEAATDRQLTVSFRARDAAGNVSDVVATAPVLIDTVAPTWSFVQPATGELFNLQSPATITIAGSSTDEDIKSVELFVDGNSTLTVQAKDLSYNFALPTQDLTVHPLRALVTDRAGNTAEFTRSFRVDRVPPSLAITNPNANYDCSAPNLCTGGIIPAQATSYALLGTATDAAGLRATNPVSVVVGSYTSGEAQKNGQDGWSFTWSNLPSVNGAEVLVTVSATDASGNTATQSRKLWVDRVAPTVSVFNDGERRVTPADALLTFSEPMSANSVNGAFSLNTVPASTPLTTASLISNDGKAFRLTNPALLNTYAAYAFTIGTGATDKVGNPLGGAVSRKFRTERAWPAAQTVASRGARPHLGLDADGNPIVFFFDTSANSARAARWNGVGAFVTNAIVTNTGMTGCTRPFSAMLDSEVDATTLALRHKVNVVHCEVATGSGAVSLWHSVSDANLAFNSAFQSQQLVPSTAIASSNPVFDLAAQLGAGFELTFAPRVRFLQTSNLVESVQNTANHQWPNTPSNYLAAASGALLADAALATGGRLYYVPTRTEVVALSGSETFSAVAGAGASSLAGTTPGHLLWAVSANGVHTVRAGCSATPGTASSWKNVAPPGLSFPSPVVHAEVRVMNGRVAYVVQTAADEVHYAFHDDAACNAAPAITSFTRVPGVARRPSIAIDRNARTGAVRAFVAYEDSAGAVKVE
ncbi:MAG: Ig-like domain-containing protein [Myxococcales bacterium]